MNRLIPICGALALAAAGAASGEDFPLTFRTIPAKDVMSFIGGTGTYEQLRAAKPAKLKKEPRAVSGKALYGEVGDTHGGGGFLVRVEESRGSGMGYDQLIVDLNQNGDLTDDPVVRRTMLPGERRTVSSEQMPFGPIQAPADKVIAGGRPVYYAQVYLYQSSALYYFSDLPASARARQNVTSGRLKLKPGWYVDTTVSVNGRKQKVGVCDGDCNLFLGDISRSQTSTTRGEKTWYFPAGDTLLVDADGSGGFNHDLFRSEALPFAPILYLGGKACKVALAPDCKSLRVEPWTETLAEVALQPRGDQVRNVTLAWEPAGGQWQLIRPAVANGKVLVPPGNYRLFESTLMGGSGSREQVMLSGLQRTPQEPVSVGAGRGNTLDCGAPLEIKVTAAQARTTSVMALGSNSGSQRPGSQPTLRISATVVGAGGELYSSFQKGEGFRSRPPKPTFKIVQAGGRTVANGNLEYG